MCMGMAGVGAQRGQRASYYRGAGLGEWRRGYSRGHQSDYSDSFSDDYYYGEFEISWVLLKFIEHLYPN